jgi:hypothetical protein
VAVDLEAALDDLYGAAPEEFVDERKRLAGALKQEGRKAEAARVLELRKPTVPAWTVNQLVRRRRKDVDALLEAGERLADAQASLLAGEGRAEFAQARRTEQAAVKRLRQSAGAILGDRASDAMLDRVAATLGAAAVTPEGRDQIARGRLTGEIEPQGFEAFAGMPAAAPARRPAAGKPAKPAKSAKPAKTAQAAAATDARERREEAVARAREAVAAARKREADVAEARREADRAVLLARKALEAAERKAARLRVDQDAAAEAVVAARHDLDAAKKA